MKPQNMLFLLVFCGMYVLSCTQKQSEIRGSSSETAQTTDKNDEETQAGKKHYRESKNQSEEESVEPIKEEKRKKQTGLRWNYSGYVGSAKIKANIVYGEATNLPGSGAIRIPISGYYFYESVKVPMAIEGSCNGVGVISFVATTEGGDEYFEGNFTNSQLGDFSGTWSKGVKSLNFVLKSAE